MESSIIAIVVIVIIAALLWYANAQLAPPAPIQRIIAVAIVVIAGLMLISPLKSLLLASMHGAS
jgi:uncharacterized protein (DUF983 family)